MVKKKRVGPISSNALLEKPARSWWVVICALTFGCLCYVPTLLDAAKQWVGSPDEQHGFLVVPTSAWLLYLRRNHFPKHSIAIDFLGIGLIAFAAGMRVYGELYIRPWLDLWSFPIWLAGAVWLLCGWRAFRWALPAIAFLFFMAPLPGQLQTAAGYPLQVLAANGGGWLLQILEQPAFVAGTTILLGDNVLDVERACAGLRMFQGMLAMAVAWSLFSRYRWPRFTALVAVAPTVAVVVNILRITFTGLLFQYVSGDAARSFTHDWAGILMIPAGALIFFLVDAFCDRIVVRNQQRPDRWLVMGSVAFSAVILAGVTGYYLHQHQQNRSTDLMLGQARTFAKSDKAEHRKIAHDLLQRYLSTRPNDAGVISELAVMNVKMGTEQWMRASRLFDLAWRADPSRTEDAIASVDLLEQLNAWQPLWERTDEILSTLDGKPRITALRLRTRAASELTAYSAAGVDIKEMFDASQAAWKEDPAHFAHMWQMAKLLLVDSSLSRLEDLASDRSSGKREELPQDLALDSSAAALEQRWRGSLSEGDTKALALIDHSLTLHPDEAELLLYRIAILDLVQAESSSLRESIRAAIVSDVETALRIVSNLKIETTESAVGSANSQEPNSQEPNSQEPNSQDRAVAASVYLVAGRFAIDQRETDRAKQLLEMSLRLQPSNYQAYLLLADLIPRDQHAERISLFSEGLKACGRRELTLLLPLAEAQLGAGQDRQAETLLKPLEAILTKFSGLDRGKIELMLASTRASGLAQQQRFPEAVTVLSNACQQQSVVSQRRNFAALYARAQFQLGSLYRTLNQDALAAAAFREGGRFNPESSIWHLDAARAYELAGNLSAALVQYQRAAAIVGRQQPNVFLAIARTLLASQAGKTPSPRDMEEVRSMIRVAAGRGADIAIASSLLAESYVVSGDLPTALAVLEGQIQQTPDVPELYFSEALVHQLAGNFDAAMADVTRYQAAGATPGRAMLLRVLLLERADRPAEALALIDQSRVRFNDVELKDPRIQVTIGLLNRGNIEEGALRLKNLASDYPNDLAVQSLAAELFEDLRMDDELVQVEANLKQLEGDSGTHWRATRAARLLRTVNTAEQNAEVANLIQRLEQLLPAWPLTLDLRGQLAERAQQWPQALAAYEAAWASGLRNAPLAGRLLCALNQNGQMDRAAEFINQMDTLVPQSTSLFDRAMPQFVQRDKSDYVLTLARRWATEDPTADNLVRLGETLMAVADVAAINESDKLLDEAEAALGKAIEKQPDNLNAWISTFRLTSQLRGNRQLAFETLEKMSALLGIQALQRNFILAQLFASIDEGARAGQLFDLCLSRAPHEGPEDRDAVALVAASFFADRRPGRAAQLCREVIAKDSPIASEFRSILINLLASHGTLDALEEAIALNEHPKPVTTDSPDRTKRFHASLLVAKAKALQQKQEDVTINRESTFERLSNKEVADINGSFVDDGVSRVFVTKRADVATEKSDSPRLDNNAGRILALRNAEVLLDGINNRTAEDAEILAEVYAGLGRPLEAFNAHRECLRLKVPTPERLIAFVDFWNRAYAAEGKYKPVAEHYLEELSRLPGQAGKWLYLKLDRIRVQRDELKTRDAEANASTAELTSAIENEAEILEQYRDRFTTGKDGDRYKQGVFECFIGLATAARTDLTATAIEGFVQTTKDIDTLLNIIAVAAIKASGASPLTADTLNEWLVKQIKVDGDPAQFNLGLLRITGDALLLNGQPAKATVFYRAALSADPHDRNTLNSLTIATAETEGAFEEAKALADQLIAMDPVNPDSLDTLLIVAILNQDWKQAEVIAQKLGETYAPATLLHRAYLALNMNRRFESEKFYFMAHDGGVAKLIQTRSDLEMMSILSKAIGSVDSDIGVANIPAARVKAERKISVSIDSIFLPKRRVLADN